MAEAVGNIIGGIIGADAASSAADTQAKAARDASQAQLQGTREGIAEQRRQYDTTRTDLTPWRTTGGAALNQLAMLLGLTVPVSQSPASTSTLTEAQIRAELLPQFTSTVNAQQPSVQPRNVPGVGGSGAGGWVQVYDHNTDSDSPREVWIPGNGAVSSSQQIVDETGLNAAVQKRLADQQQALTQTQNAQAQNDAASSNPLFGTLARGFTMDDYLQDPGYQFRMDQGEQAINRAAAAAGRYDSGRALKDLTEFNSGLASQEFGNAYNRWNTDQTNLFNRLSSVAGTGQQAVNTGAQAGSNTSNAIANLLASGGNSQANSIIGAGNASAAGTIGAANAWGNALGGTTNALSQYFTNKGTPSQTGVTLYGLRT